MVSIRVYIIIWVLICNIRWFNGQHVHGTIMPRESSMKAKYGQRSMSYGLGMTVTKKNADKARERKIVRIQSQKRQEYWLSGDLNKDS